jgi:hypothetical protein
MIRLTAARRSGFLSVDGDAVRRVGQAGLGTSAVRRRTPTADREPIPHDDLFRSQCQSDGAASEPPRCETRLNTSGIFLSHKNFEP